MRFQKRLVVLGFTMKQFSLYEREVRHGETKRYIIQVLTEELPATGVKTLYALPDEINNQQLTFLGEKAIRKSTSEPGFTSFKI